MAKPQSTFKNMLFALLGVTVVASASLGLVNDATHSAIVKAENDKQTKAISSVLPPFSKLGEPKRVMPKEGKDSITIYPALNEKGETVANAVKTYTYKGFSGYIEVMTGFDKEGNISGFQVLKHAETPGLGSKMDEWFSNNKKETQCIIGKSPEKVSFMVTKDGGNIDAITAATISSRAFLDAINRAYSVLNQQYETDAVSSATQQN
jgi:Na+-translocating ferredoxin:NAD+ oxidoreductase subunit G